jgi:hypothetical protein
MLCRALAGTVQIESYEVPKVMICANKECAKDFEPKTHNQKYCTDECCRIATNRRIMEKVL